MKRNTLGLIAATLLACLLNACNPNTVDVPVELKNVEMVLEAPVFAGSNTLQAETALALDQAFEQAGADKNQITEAVLTSATLRQKNGAAFDNYESVLLQLFNEKTPMTELAQLTTIPAGTAELSLAVSKEKNATEFFKQDKIGIVVDANLKADDTTALALICDLKFTLKAKAK